MIDVQIMDKVLSLIIFSGLFSSFLVQLQFWMEIVLTFC